MGLIERRDRVALGDCSNSAATSFDIRDVSSGIVIMIAAESDVGNVTFQVSDDGTTFVDLVDAEGSPISITDPNPGEAFALPDDLFAAHYVKLIASASATSAVKLMLKG